MSKVSNRFAATCLVACLLLCGCLTRTATTTVAESEPADDLDKISEHFRSSGVLSHRTDYWMMGPARASSVSNSVVGSGDCVAFFGYGEGIPGSYFVVAFESEADAVKAEKHKCFVEQEEDDPQHPYRKGRILLVARKSAGKVVESFQSFRKP